jgi:cell division septation protein DedD
MGSGGRRRGAGERVLESRHVIGLFMLMLLFSGVFFALGYVMGRNEYGGEVRAAAKPHGNSEIPVGRKPVLATEVVKTATPESEPAADVNSQPSSDWGFYNAGKVARTEDNLRPLAPAAAPKPVAAVVKGKASGKVSNVSTKSVSAPLASGASYTLQVAALRKESDALTLATHLQKKKFPSFVISPQSDKYYRVQVGPYADQKSAEAAKKGLEDAGFKAIVKH